MTKLNLNPKANHTVKVECDYCPGYQKKVLEDDDSADVEGTTEDFMITSPKTKRTRKVCDRCIRKIQLEDQIIGLLDFHLKKP